MKKKIKYENLGWAAFSLIVAFGFHWLSQNYVIGNDLEQIELTVTAQKNNNS